jgi:hypothetical protein
MKNKKLAVMESFIQSTCSSRLVHYYVIPITYTFRYYTVTIMLCFFAFSLQLHFCFTLPHFTLLCIWLLSSIQLNHCSFLIALCSTFYCLFNRKKEYVHDINAVVWLISTDIHDSLFLFQPDKAVSSVLSGPVYIKLSAVCYKYYSLFKGEVTHGKAMQDGSQLVSKLPFEFNWNVSLCYYDK